MLQIIPPSSCFQTFLLIRKFEKYVYILSFVEIYTKGIYVDLGGSR